MRPVSWCACAPPPSRRPAVGRRAPHPPRRDIAPVMSEEKVEIVQRGVADAARYQPSGSLVLGIAVDGLSPGRDDREARAPSAPVQGLDRDQLEAVRGRPAGRRSVPVPVDVAGVAAAGDVEVAEGAAPGGAMDDARIGEPASRAAAVVVSVVRGGPGFGSGRPDPHLIALPVVLVEAGITGQVAQARRVLVVEPVLDVEVAHAPTRAVEPVGGALRPGAVVAAVDDVNEGGGGLTGAGAPDRP